MIEKGRVQMIHAAFVPRPGVLDRTIAAIDEYGLSGPQAICLYADCPPETYDLELCHLMQYARINGFPKYVLLDKTGKILYRGSFVKKEKKVLQEKLKALGLI